MATLSVTEFSNQGIDGERKVVSAVSVYEITNNSITTSATSAQSNAFSAETTIVRVVTDAASHIEFGTNPTATTSSAYLPANAVEYFSVPKGKSFKIAGITA